MKGPANQVKYRRKPAAAGNLQEQIPEPLHRLSLVGGKGLRRSPVNRERPVHTVCHNSRLQNAPPKGRILRCHVRHVNQRLIELPGIEHDGRGENHRPAQRMAKIKLLRNMDHASRSLRIRIPEFIGGKNKRRVLLAKEQQLLLELCRKPEIIRIQVSDVTSPCLCDTMISGFRRPKIPLVSDNPYFLSVR